MNFGKRAADGTIEQDINECALSGRPIIAGDVLVNVSGTPYFYRVSAVAFPQLTQERRAEIEAQVRRPVRAAAPTLAAEEK